MHVFRFSVHLYSPHWYVTKASKLVRWLACRVNKVEVHSLNPRWLAFFFLCICRPTSRARSIQIGRPSRLIPMRTDVFLTQNASKANPIWRCRRPLTCILQTGACSTPYWVGPLLCTLFHKKEGSRRCDSNHRPVGLMFDSITITTHNTI